MFQYHHLQGMGMLHLTLGKQSKNPAFSISHIQYDSRAKKLDVSSYAFFHHSYLYTPAETLSISYQY